MRIHNEISLQAPADELFAFLSDVERVGPCLPGASIEGRDGDDYAGSMKVKVGPINATYQGKLRFVELDKEARRVYQEEIDATWVRAAGMIGISLLARAIGSFLIGLSKPKIPFKMFGELEQAIAWARELNRAGAPARLDVQR